MDDTIAAIATAYGEGSIGIIRLSGDNAREILNRIFQSKSKSFRESIANKRLYYGHIIDPSNFDIIDEVLVVYMKAPTTYTAEDVVEIFCHGSIIALRKILNLSLKCGARLAEKGEFTKRAFLNGRLDLSQAEAVIDLIRAKTDKSFEIALKQMDGLLSLKVREIRESLLNLLVEITVNIDYPDEDIEEMTYSKLTNSIKTINDNLQQLLTSATTGKIIKDGIHISIIGKPNVGKSSLLNALIKESRAIVTDIPGTTRDTIEESIKIRDIPVILTDTAGIRNTEDQIERIGIEKSKESFNKADLIVFMMDGSQEIGHEDEMILDAIGDRKVIVLINKSDMSKVMNRSDVKSRLPNSIVLETSIKNNTGIEELENTIEEMVFDGAIRQEDSLMITNVRHENLLIQANQSLNDAYKMAERMEALDFIEIDVKRAYELLGEIIGESVSDDILSTVFERFCLGK